MPKWNISLELQHEESGDSLQREFLSTTEVATLRKLMARRRDVKVNRIQLSHNGKLLDKDTDNLMDAGLIGGGWIRIKVTVLPPPPPAHSTPAAAVAAVPARSAALDGQTIPVTRQWAAEVLAEAQAVAEQQAVIRTSMGNIQETFTAFQASQSRVQRSHDELVSRLEAHIAQLEAHVNDLREQLHTKKHRSKPVRSDRDDEAARDRQTPRKKSTHTK